MQQWRSTLINAQIITMLNHENSVAQTNRCIESSKAVGNKFDINIFEASLLDTTNWDALGIKYLHLYGNKPNMPACTMSHWRLWEMAADTNEPVLCLEHDAVFIKEFTQEHLDEIMESQYQVVALYNPHGQNDGNKITHLSCGTPAHAYVMKPEGARHMMLTAKLDRSISQHDRNKWLSKFSYLGGYVDWIVEDSKEWRESNLGTSKTM